MRTTYTITAAEHTELLGEIAKLEGELGHAETMIARYDAEIAAQDPMSDDQFPYWQRRPYVKQAGHARKRIAEVTAFLDRCTIKRDTAAAEAA